MQARRMRDDFGDKGLSGEKDMASDEGSVVETTPISSDGTTTRGRPVLRCTNVCRTGLGEALKLKVP